MLPHLRSAKLRNAMGFEVGGDYAFSASGPKKPESKHRAGVYVDDFGSAKASKCSALKLLTTNCVIFS